MLEKHQALMDIVSHSRGVGKTYAAIETTKKTDGVLVVQSETARKNMLQKEELHEDNVVSVNNLHTLRGKSPRPVIIDPEILFCLFDETVAAMKTLEDRFNKLKEEIRITCDRV